MTEYSKIPHSEDSEPQKNSSLLERARGAFGFEPFAASPIKGRLPEREMKRAKVRKEEQKKQKELASRMGQADLEPNPDTVATAEVPKTGQPVPRSMSVSVPSQDIEAVTFSGKKLAIDRDHLSDQGLIVPEAVTTALVEEFRIVKRRILKSARELDTTHSRRLLVCSPHPGEGKTFCSTNLAIAIAAEWDREVLLVDADFAKPSILSTLGLPKQPGFMDCLADHSLKPEDLVIGTDIEGLWVLPAGNQTNLDSEYLNSDRTAEVLDRLTMGMPNRMLIFDTPPVLAASQAADMAKHVGQVLLIARADITTQSALEDACQLLCACPDIKLLLNAVKFSPSGRNFGAYYGYED